MVTPFTLKDGFIHLGSNINLRSLRAPQYSNVLNPQVRGWDLKRAESLPVLDIYLHGVG